MPYCYVAQYGFFKNMRISLKHNGKSFNISEIKDDEYSPEEDEIILEDEDINRIYKLYTKKPIEKINIERDEIEKIVCSLFKIEKADLYKKSRRQSIVVGRQIIFYCYYLISYGSLKKIGNIYGKHHATVIHSIHSMEKVLESQDKKVYPFLKKVLTYFNLWNSNYDTLKTTSIKKVKSYKDTDEPSVKTKPKKREIKVNYNMIQKWKK